MPDRKILLNDRAQHGQQQMGVASRPHLQMDVGPLSGLRPPRIDDDQLSPRIVRNFLQHLASPRKSMRLPRIGADHQQEIGMFSVLGRMAGLVAE